MLELMSAPKKWEMGDGEIAEITTPWTTRAKELQVQTASKLLRSLTTLDTLDTRA